MTILGVFPLEKQKNEKKFDGPAFFFGQTPGSRYTKVHWQLNKTEQQCS